MMTDMLAFALSTMIVGIGGFSLGFILGRFARQILGGDSQ
jgi:hypothetical protein